jgi:phosphoribosylamine--glycine ligase
MKVLILGHGGREHALADTLRRSKSTDSVFLHPGNAGTRREGFSTLGDADPADPQALAIAAKERNVGLVVIGPETYLAQGYADLFRRDKFLVVGPDRISAQLETSKVFAKHFLQNAGIPTSPFTVAEDKSELLRKVMDRKWPQVLKLDGLAAGKGVVIAENREDVHAFAHRIYVAQEFGKGPHRVVVESYLTGNELSYMGLCDGETFIPLSSATDFKRVSDGNLGPNTGGMGAISPSPYFLSDLESRIHSRIVSPLLTQLKKENLPYRGILYIGLMITESGDPYVLEFNARFGDPETQAVLPRLQSDFGAFLESTATGSLKDLPPLRWTKDTCVYVVGAAEGYPGPVKTGDEINGLETVKAPVRVFYSGVEEKAGKLFTNGGRVLGVGATGNTAEEASQAAYLALGQIHWRGMHYRSDIGRG